MKCFVKALSRLNISLNARLQTFSSFSIIICSTKEVLLNSVLYLIKLFNIFKLAFQNLLCYSANLITIRGLKLKVHRNESLRSEISQFIKVHIYFSAYTLYQQQTNNTNNTFKNFKYFNSTSSKYFSLWRFLIILIYESIHIHPSLMLVISSFLI